MHRNIETKGTTEMKGKPDKGYALTPQREKVLRILASAGGSLHDESGLVVSKLREQTGHESTQALSMVIKQLETSGLIRRDVAGRRTYSLNLIEDAIAPEDRSRIGLTSGVANGSVQVGQTVAQDSPYDRQYDETPLPGASGDTDGTADGTADGTDASDNTDGPDYRKLADELLKSALAALASKAGDPKLKLQVIELQGQVAEFKERILDLESRLVERGEECLRLQEQLRIAEHNLSVVQTARAKQQAERGSDTIDKKITPRERAELRKLMEALPGGG